MLTLHKELLEILNLIKQLFFFLLQKKKQNRSCRKLLLPT